MLAVSPVIRAVTDGLIFPTVCSPPVDEVVVSNEYELPTVVPALEAAQLGAVPVP